jgi:hypothetical protein
MEHREIEHVTMVGVNELITIINETPKGQFITITADTIPDMNKTGNPFHGKVIKRSITQSTSKPDFGTAVENRREKLGMEDREIHPRKWGVRLDGTPYVVHMKKGETELRIYLEMNVFRCISTVFVNTETGQEINKEEIKPYLNVSKPSQEDLYWRDYDVRGIVKFVAGGRAYGIDKNFRLTEAQAALASELIVKDKARREAEKKAKAQTV